MLKWEPMNERNGPLNTKELRALRREEKLKQEQEKIRKARNKRYLRLGVGAALMLTLSVGAASRIYITNQDSLPPRPSKTNISNESLRSSFTQYDELLRNEVNRLGLKRDPEEVKIWMNSGIYPLETSDDMLVKISYERLNKIRSLMKNSRISIVKDASNFLESKVLPPTNLHINIHRSIPGTYMTAKPELVNNNDIDWGIDVNSEAFVRNVDGPTAAIILIHELEHVKDGIIFDKNNLYLSPVDRFEALKRYSENIDDYIAVEARGYGAQARAFIAFSGAFGVEGRDKGSKNEELAVNFIRLGSDPNSDAWRSYIANEIIQDAITSRKIRQSAFKS